jgi:hypothetical protein
MFYLTLHTDCDVLAASSEILVFFYQTAWCHIPDDINLHIPWQGGVTSPTFAEILK